MEEHGIDFGEQEDVASCMMRIASDKSVNGKQFGCPCPEK